MRLQGLSRNSAILSLKRDFYSGEIQNNEAFPNIKLCGEEFFSKILDRKWTLLSPDTKIHQIMVSGTQGRHGGGPVGNVSFLNNTHPSLGDSMMVKNNLQPSFYIVRDDLLHPLINGNKARKLDALLPLIEDHLVTDVVTCGGCQSAHAAAVAVSCAESGLKSHLLLRGEQPEISTGYNLISTIYGNVTYIPRSVYAKRDEMLTRHAELVAGSRDSILWLSNIFEASFVTPISNQENFLRMDAHRCAEKSKKVVIVNEGAADVVGLLGVIRLVQYLSQNEIFGKEQALKIIVDSGTGTTAVGLGLGAICLGLPWEVVGVMLADTDDGYKKQEKNLISEFQKCCAFTFTDHILGRVDGGVVHWVERSSPRKFGNVLTGEVKACQQIAQQTGVLVDPIYTLAAWELATQFSQEEANGGVKVVMLHTGGTLGMFGIAQRYKSFFNALKDRSFFPL